MIFPTQLEELKSEFIKLEKILISEFGQTYMEKQIFFDFFNSKGKAIATANRKSHCIAFNLKYYFHLTPEEKIEILRHEVAHIASFMDMKKKTGYAIEISKKGLRQPHGPNWKKWAKRLGAQPRASVKLVNSADTPKSNVNYTLQCSRCTKEIAKFNRLTDKRRFIVKNYNSRCCGVAFLLKNKNKVVINDFI